MSLPNGVLPLQEEEAFPEYRLWVTPKMEYVAYSDRKQRYSQSRQAWADFFPKLFLKAFTSFPASYFLTRELSKKESDGS